MASSGRLEIRPLKIDDLPEMTAPLQFGWVLMAAGTFDLDSYDTRHAHTGRCVDGPASFTRRAGQRGLVFVGNEYFMHGSYLFVFILLVTNRLRASGKGVACPDENPNDIHPLQAAPADGLLNKVIDRL